MTENASNERTNESRTSVTRGRETEGGDRGDRSELPLPRPVRAQAAGKRGGRRVTAISVGRSVTERGRMCPNVTECTQM
eukprot:1175616-Prorocentrum_minimum.AAC.2